MSFTFNIQSHQPGKYFLKVSFSNFEIRDRVKRIDQEGRIQRRWDLVEKAVGQIKEGERRLVNPKLEALFGRVSAVANPDGKALSFAYLHSGASIGDQVLIGKCQNGICIDNHDFLRSENDDVNNNKDHLLYLLVEEYHAARYPDGFVGSAILEREYSDYLRALYYLVPEPQLGGGILELCMPALFEVALLGGRRETTTIWQPLDPEPYYLISFSFPNGRGESIRYNSLIYKMNLDPSEIAARGNFHTFLREAEVLLLKAGRSELDDIEDTDKNVEDNFGAAVQYMSAGARIITDRSMGEVDSLPLKLVGSPISAEDYTDHSMVKFGYDSAYIWERLEKFPTIL